MVKSIKLCTMVKDERDIVEDWLRYHGYIFGFRNLYVIDNFSTDGTFEILQKYQKKYNISLFRKKDYSLKGKYMDELVSKFKNKIDIVYPLDIDEFIILFNRESNKINISNIRLYLNSLSTNYSVYKTNYIGSTISCNNNFGYHNACRECKYGIYLDYGSMAKSFINLKKWNGSIDHGNHIPDKNYLLTDLCLVHFHCRNLKQVKKKTLNNVLGFGYDTNNLEKHLHDAGNHHVKRLLEIKNNNFVLGTNYKKDENSIDLSELNNFIINLDKLF